LNLLKKNTLLFVEILFRTPPEFCANIIDFHPKSEDDYLSDENETVVPLKIKKWTKDEDKLLLAQVKKYKTMHKDLMYDVIAGDMSATRTRKEIEDRHQILKLKKTKKGYTSDDEGIANLSESDTEETDANKIFTLDLGDLDTKTTEKKQESDTENDNINIQSPTNKENNTIYDADTDPDEPKTTQLQEPVFSKTTSFDDNLMSQEVPLPKKRKRQQIIDENKEEHSEIDTDETVSLHRKKKILKRIMLDNDDD